MVPEADVPFPLSAFQYGPPPPSGPPKQQWFRSGAERFSWRPDYCAFSFVLEPIRNTIRGGVAERPLFRGMPASAAALVRRQKRMRIWLQARQHTLTLRGSDPPSPACRSGRGG